MKWEVFRITPSLLKEEERMHRNIESCEKNLNINQGFIKDLKTQKKVKYLQTCRNQNPAKIQKKRQCIVKEKKSKS